MATRLRHARRFQSSGTRTDDDDLALRPTCLCDHVRHGFFTGGRGVLHAQHVEPVVLAVDAIVRADTLLDLVLATVADLDDHMRIGNLRAGHANQIDHAAREQTFRLTRVANTLRVHHRQLHHRLDTRREMHERFGRQRHWRHAVRQCVVRIRARTDHTQVVDQAGFAHRLSDFFQLFVIETVFMEFVATHTQTDAEIRADRFAHGIQHFRTETQTVFERTAPFVSAEIRARAPELIDQMLVGGRNFDAVHPGILHTLCGRCKIRNDAANFFHFNDLRVAAVHRLTHTGWRHQMRPMFTMKRRAAAHVRGLNHDLRAVPMHRFGEPRKRIDDLVGREVHRLPPALRAIDRHRARAAAHGEADTALGLLFVVTDIAIAGQTARFRIHLRVRGADDAVTQRQFVQRERLEKVRVTHRDRPRN